MLGRTIRNGKGFEFCELDEVETHETIKGMEIFNCMSFFRILSFVRLHSDKIAKNLSTGQLISIALAIFQQSSIKGYTALETALNRKVNVVKEFSRTEQESAYEQQIAERSERKELEYV